jgi:hypothetical protein
LSQFADTTPCPCPHNKNIKEKEASDPSSLFSGEYKGQLSEKNMKLTRECSLLEKKERETICNEV